MRLRKLVKNNTTQFPILLTFNDKKLAIQSVDEFLDVINTFTEEVGSLKNSIDYDNVIENIKEDIGSLEESLSIIKVKLIDFKKNLRQKDLKPLLGNLKQLDENFTRTKNDIEKYLIDLSIEHYPK